MGFGTPETSLLSVMLADISGAKIWQWTHDPGFHTHCQFARRCQKGSPLLCQRLAQITRTWSHQPPRRGCRACHHGELCRSDASATIVVRVNADAPGWWLTCGRQSVNHVRFAETTTFYQATSSFEFGNPECFNCCVHQICLIFPTAVKQCETMWNNVKQRETHCKTMRKNGK